MSNRPTAFTPGVSSIAVIQRASRYMRPPSRTFALGTRSLMWRLAASSMRAYSCGDPLNAQRPSGSFTISKWFATPSRRSAISPA